MAQDQAHDRRLPLAASADVGRERSFAVAAALVAAPGESARNEDGCRIAGPVPGLPLHRLDSVERGGTGGRVEMQEVREGGRVWRRVAVVQGGPQLVVERIAADLEPVAAGSHVSPDGGHCPRHARLLQHGGEFPIGIEDRQEVGARERIEHGAGGAELDHLEPGCLDGGRSHEPVAPIGHRHDGPTACPRPILQRHQPDFRPAWLRSRREVFNGRGDQVDGQLRLVGLDPASNSEKRASSAQGRAVEIRPVWRIDEHQCRLVPWRRAIDDGELAIPFAGKLVAQPRAAVRRDADRHGRVVVGPHYQAGPEEADVAARSRDLGLPAYRVVGGLTLEERRAECRAHRFTRIAAGKPAAPSDRGQNADAREGQTQARSCSPAPPSP